MHAAQRALAARKWTHSGIICFSQSRLLQEASHGGDKAIESGGPDKSPIEMTIAMFYPSWFTKVGFPTSC